MASTLSTDPAQVRAYPFAVRAENVEGGVDFIHFSDKRAAAMFAFLMNEKATCYVATDFDQTWREVEDFVL